MANTTLSITYGSAGNKNKWTWSAWVKRSKLGGHQSLFSRYADGNNIGDLRFQSDDGFTYQNYNNGSTNAQWNASQKFRDTNAWYHIVFVWDTGQATASDRIKVYVNGENMAGSANAVPAQNTNSLINASATHKIGSRNSDQYFDGSMTHIHFCDGYAYSPTDFGEYDANGVWKIKTSPSVSYGTNGFFILKDGNSVTDQSGNGNNFTVGGGTLTNTEDNPSNVFATLNPLNYTSSAVSYSNGNTKGTYPGTWIASQGTIGGMTGKYFWEAKVNSGNDANLFYGICRPNIDLDTSPQNQTGVICQHILGDRYVDGTYTASTAETLANGDILGVALDLDSATKTVKFYKNGTLLSSGSSINLTSTYDNEFVLPFFAGNNSSASSIWETNFGNGYFSSTAVASAGTNASGNGIFEYDVPTGYTALSTKGLNL